MVYDWYKIINKGVFLDMGLPSIPVELILEDIGLREILVVKGRDVGIVYEDIFLGVQMNGNNPFHFEGHAVYLDSNNDIWLGVTPEQ
jgi:hypothetical protein